MKPLTLSMNLEVPMMTEHFAVIATLMSFLFVLGLSPAFSQPVPMPVPQSQGHVPSTLCHVFCSGCGCRGGVGYRTIRLDGKKGDCVSRDELRKRCGPEPRLKCRLENVGLDARCGPAPLPVAPPQLAAPPVEVDLIDPGFAWSYRESDRVLMAGVPRKIEEIVSVLRVDLKVTDEIVFIGTASSEGLRDAEEWRAQERADFLASVVIATGKLTNKAWTLSLGQYTVDCGDCSEASSALQRPLLIARVRRNAEVVDLELALKSALGKALKNVIVDRYSQFELSSLPPSKRTLAKP